MARAIVFSILALLLWGCTPPTNLVDETPTAEIQAPVPTQALSRLPLSDAGPQLVGMQRLVKLVDAKDPDRKVMLTIWYPAVAAEGAEAWQDVKSDALPDRSAAPYPLILTATTFGSSFAAHLASYGFVVAGVEGQDWSDHWGAWQFEHPEEILFALDQISTQGVPGLEGMIDSDRTGVMGYSFGSGTALMLGGARVDPEYYQAQCAQAASMTPAPPEAWLDYICNVSGGWDTIAASAKPEITNESDGLWAPITDDRIQAVIAMAPEGAWLFGERGLRAVDRPTLLFGATEDVNNYYELEAAAIYEGLTSTERTLVSFVDDTHMMLDVPERLAQMQHFAVAFFGLHLKQDEGMTRYLSQEFIEGYDDLSWGVYKRE